jgi:ADP-heptose:LPS heptosyltransferase
LFSKCDVREIGALMANTEVFIGGDSGIMHLASASKVSTVDFSRDNINMYALITTIVAINTNTDSIDDYIAVLDKILR